MQFFFHLTKLMLTISVIAFNPFPVLFITIFVVSLPLFLPSLPSPRTHSLTPVLSFRAVSLRNSEKKESHVHIADTSYAMHVSFCFHLVLSSMCSWTTFWTCEIVDIQLVIKFPPLPCSDTYDDRIMIACNAHRMLHFLQTLAYQTSISLSS